MSMKQLAGGLGAISVIILVVFLVLQSPQKKVPASSGETEMALSDEKTSQSPDHTPQAKRPKHDQGEASETKGLVVFGTVSLAADDMPVPGAKVSILNEESYRGYLPFTVETNQAGEFEFTQVDMQRFVVFAQKDRLVSFEKREDLEVLGVDEQDTAIGPIHLKLYPVDVLKIKVTSSLDGKMLEGATARTVFKPEMAFEDEGDGLIEIPLTKENWALQIAAPGYATKLLNLDFSRGFKDAVEVALAPGGRLFGLVFDGQGDPVADAWVRAEFVGMRVKTKTDAYGNYELPHLPFQKKMRIFALKKDVGSFFENITLQPGGEENKNIVIRDREKHLGNMEKFQLEGRVVDSSDRPLADATVDYSPFSREMFSQSQTTDQDGRFTIEVMQVGFSRNRLTVSKPGYALQVVPFQLDATTKVQLKIVLQEGHFLEGLVLSKEGEPVADARLMAKNPAERFSQLAQTLTDHDGFFRLEDLPAEINLEIFAKSFSQFKLEKPELDRKDARFVLDRLGKIVGRVVYKDTGKPVKSFKIFLHKKSTMDRDYFNQDSNLYAEGLMIEADDGAFEFEGLKIQQEYLISIRADKYGLEKPFETKVLPLGEETPHLLELEPFGKKIEGVVVTSSGKSLAGVTLTLTGSPADVSESMMGDDPVTTFKEVSTSNQAGRFVFDAVPENIKLSLTGQKTGYAKTSLAHYETNRSDDSDLSVTLYREGVLTVIVKKKPMPQVTTLALSQGTTSIGRVRLSPGNEEATFTELKPGNYFIYLRGQEGIAMSTPVFTINEQVELAEGESREIVLGDDGERELSGIALVGGLPAAQRQLCLSTVSPGHASRPYLMSDKKTMTDANGYFVFEDLTPEQYMVSLMPRQPRWQSRGSGTFIVNPGNGQTVTIAASDVEETLSFPKFSRVYGGVDNGRGIANMLLSKHPTDAIGNAFLTPLDQGSGFQFLDVGPGVYSLHVLEGQPPKSRLILREITIPEDGSDLDLGEVNANPDGSVRLTLHANWVTNDLTSLKFQILGEGATAVGDLPVEGDLYDWRDLANPYVVEGLAAGQYLFALTDSSLGFVCEPKVPKFEIQQGLETDVAINLVPITHLTVKVPIEQKIISATMQHGESNEVIEFSRALTLDVPALMRESETVAIILPFKMIAAGLNPGPWSLQVKLKTGAVSNQDVFLELGKPVSVELGAQKRKSLKAPLTPKANGSLAATVSKGKGTSQKEK